MFIPLASSMIKSIKANGNIQFRTAHGWEFIAPNRLVPNDVVYVTDITGITINLFECVISIGKSIMIIDALDVYTKPEAFLVSYKTRFKALVHFYLGFAIDEAMAMAESHGKSRIIVRSALPGTADVLFKRNFTVRPQDIFNKIETTEAFKGIKKLKEAQYERAKRHDNSTNLEKDQTS